MEYIISFIGEEGARSRFVGVYKVLSAKKLEFDVCTTSVKPRLGNELFIEIERKPASQCSVNLYKLNGITCSGCSNTVTQSLGKVPGVTAVSINTTYTEVMVVSNQPVTIGQLQKALEFNPTYRLMAI